MSHKSMAGLFSFFYNETCKVHLQEETVKMTHKERV